VPETIGVASSESDYAAFGALIREYWGWLNVRYASVPGAIDAIGSHQGLEDELKTLSTVYGPPTGEVLLAHRDSDVVGGGAYRDLGAGACEMKRLFVPERHQGHGTGRRLCEGLILAATEAGFERMLLDTGELNTEAIAMYEALGFVRCPPYHEYPEVLMAHLVFMEKRLDPTKQG
jgi:GNAT superfamily N-acetyltransferase